MTNNDNAITELCEAVGRLGGTSGRSRVTKTVRSFLDELSDALGTPLDPEDMDATLAKLGGIAKMIGATLRNSAAPTMLGAGYKVNVIPGPGHRDTSTAASCRATRRSSWPTSTGSSARGSSARTCTATRRWRPASTATWWTRCRSRSRRRTRSPAPCRTCSPAAPTPSPSTTSASAASGFAPLQAAAGAGLRGHVPRGGRAGAGRRAEVRGAGAGPPAAYLPRTCRAAAHVKQVHQPAPFAPPPGHSRWRLSRRLSTHHPISPMMTPRGGKLSALVGARCREEQADDRRGAAGSPTTTRGHAATPRSRRSEPGRPRVQHQRLAERECLDVNERSQQRHRQQGDIAG